MVAHTLMPFQVPSARRAPYLQLVSKALSQLEDAADPLLPAAWGVTWRDPACDNSMSSLFQARCYTQAPIVTTHTTTHHHT